MLKGDSETKPENLYKKLGCWDVRLHLQASVMLLHNSNRNVAGSRCRFFIVPESELSLRPSLY